MLSVLLPLIGVAQDQVGTVAGLAGEPGAADGQGTGARFNDPSGITVGPDGRIYLADSRNHIIRVIGTNGLVETLAGSAGEAGSADGVGAAARFDHPSGIAIDPAGNVIVGDTGNHTLRRISPSGIVTTLAGAAGQAEWLDGNASRFRSPIGLAIAANGDIYVADCGNHVIRRLDSSGNVTTFAGQGEVWGSNDGLSTNAKFNSPLDLCFDSLGNLFVSDANNYTIRKITPSGHVSLFVGQPGQDGARDGLSARFGKPAELAIDSFDRLYVADSLNHTLRRIRPDGFVSTIAGSVGTPGGGDGINGAARFFNPYGLAITPDGRLMVSDAYNQTVREVLAPFDVAVLSGGGQVVLTWDAVIGRRYVVEQSSDPAGASWTPVGSEHLANQPLITVTNTTASSDLLFFRVLRSP